MGDIMGDHSAESLVARFHRERIGECDLIAISDGGLNYPAPMVFGGVPAEASSQLGLPEKQVFFNYTILLAETQGRRVLMDVGAGDFGNQGDAVFPGLDHSTSRTNLVIPSLEAAGIAPSDIDTVLITHAHPDHIGGLTDLGGDLAFPQARYLVGRKEHDFWQSADPTKVEAEALRHHMELLVNAAKGAFRALEGRLDFVEVGDEILPGIRVEAAYGHTHGQLMVSISSGGQQADNITDVVVHPLFVEHPDWAAGLDMDAKAADQTRRRFFAHAAESKTLVFGHHLGPFPNFGRIVQKGETFQWEPIVAADS